MADDASNGQESLMNVLSAWQSTLAYMAVPHVDEKAAAGSLRKMHQVTMGHIAQLEAHAKAVDQAAASQVTCAQRAESVCIHRIRTPEEGQAACTFHDKCRHQHTLHVRLFMTSAFSTWNPSG
jgi:hypothetical protein